MDKKFSMETKICLSCLKVGTDMVDVFCLKSSATAIKSYFPELIVHPVFDIEQDA